MSTTQEKAAPNSAKLEKIDHEFVNLKAERVRLRKKGEQLEQQWAKLNAREEALGNQRKAEQLRLHIGGNVRLACRWPLGSRLWHLNNVAGVLLEVKRTRCRVDFGKHFVWMLPIADVMPEGGEQGFVMTFGTEGK